MKKDVTDTDMGLDKLLSDLNKLDSKVIKVGLFSEDRSYDGTMNIAKLGAMNEKGWGIPKRDFMMESAIVNEQDIASIMTSNASDMMFSGKSPEEVINKVGKSYENMVKGTIQDFSYPPNAEATIAIKGRNDPLVHHYKMISSVKFKVVGKR